MRILPAVIEIDSPGPIAGRGGPVAGPRRVAGRAARLHSVRARLIACCLGVALIAGCDAVGPAEEDEMDRGAAALAAGWAIVDIGGGFHPSLALDSAGEPALSYTRGVPDPSHVDGGDTTAAFASNDGTWRSGTGWTTADISLIPGKIDGFANALGFSPAAQVAYTSRTRLDRDSGFILQFARQTNGPWQVTTVESTPWVWQVKQRVKDETTLLGYVSTARTGVLVASSTSGGDWTRSALPDMPRDLLSSMDVGLAAAVDGEKDKLHAGVATSTLFPTSVPAAPRGLHFAASADGGNTWGAIVHVDTSGPMIGPQTAFAGANPLLSYSDVDQKLAKLASSDDGGVTWSVETVAAFTSAPSTGLAVDADGAPLLAIVVPDSATFQDFLYFARRDSKTGWSLELVDSVAWSLGLRLGANPRIATTADGSIVIAYDYGTQVAHHVRFAWSPPL